MLFKFFGCTISLLISIQCSAQPTFNGTKTTQEAQTKEKKPILLIVSYDGFRNEYLRRGVTPNMLQFRNEGVYADHMLNVFPTKTFTNHYSISTGFYPDEHGVLGNNLYDSIDGNLSYSYKLFHYNESILPIWVVNEKAGGHSGCMMWPGTDFKYAETGCTHTMKYSNTVPLMDRVDTVMKWLTDPMKPANLVMLYSEQPDKLAHVVGPDSNNITDMVASLDLLTKYIQDQLRLYKLENRTNVIHLSDHGMVGVPLSKFINLTDYLEADTYQINGASPVLQIVPALGKLDYVYQSLKNASKSNGNFDVYKSKDLPSRWHATNERRFGPIIVVAKVNYAFQDLWKYTQESTTFVGEHGYDNEEDLMHPIFIAKGPAFKSGGKQVKPFETVDLFYLFTRILGIDNSTSRNGCAARISNVLLGEPDSSDTTTIIIVLVSLGAMLAVIIYVIKFYKKQKLHFYSRT